MQRLTIALFTLASFWATTASAKTVHYNVQCWAEGHKFRVNSESVKDYLTSSRLFLKMDAKDDAVVLTEYIGHVSGAKYVEGRDELTTVDFYSQFLSTESGEIASSLSPRATVYVDSKYWRFKNFAESAATSQDGGGMQGVLVVSKKYDAEGDATFDAHYVFQHGDHTGGTISFTCSRD